MVGSRFLRDRCGDAPKPYHQNHRFEYFISVGPVARPQHKACPNRILDHIGTAFFSAVVGAAAMMKRSPLPLERRFLGTGQMASFPNRGSEFEVRQVRSHIGSLCSIVERLNGRLLWAVAERGVRGIADFSLI
jgi:hypothetical protein